MKVQIKLGFGALQLNLEREEMTHDNIYIGIHLIGCSFGDSFTYGSFTCKPESQGMDDVYLCCTRIVCCTDYLQLH